MIILLADKKNNLVFKRKFIWYPKKIKITIIPGLNKYLQREEGYYLIWLRSVGIFENPEYPDPDNIDKWSIDNRFLYFLPKYSWRTLSSL